MQWAAVMAALQCMQMASRRCFAQLWPDFTHFLLLSFNLLFEGGRWDIYEVVKWLQTIRVGPTLDFNVNM